MIYADYTFYKANWSGKIPEDKYNFIATQASNQINYVTFDRITEDTVTDKIRLCQCELSDYMYALEQAVSAQEVVEGKGVVKAETVDTYKVEYEAPALSQRYATGKAKYNSADAAMMGICQKYLTRPTNLMFVGMEETV